NSTDMTLGLRYVPVAGLALRASYGTGFLPPNTAQLAQRTLATAIFGVNDPLRGGTPAGGGDVLLDGAPDLDPEDSKSWSAGIILTPSKLPGLRLSLDYTRIKKTNEIATLTSQQVVDNEAFLPGRVVRGPKLGTDPASWAGPIQVIDRS